MKKILVLGFLGLLILSNANGQQAAGESGLRLPAEKLGLIRAACFEVVAQKPVQDSMTYDKPLNWDLQDYSIRNDRYIPLGTAFAISATEAVTAAHVFDLTPGSQIYKSRFIRDKVRPNGKTEVYEVENISAFSENRDYVVFTVKGKTFDRWLKIDTAFEQNAAIYTAGNAYGEGIVIREGTLLDETPESENGAWNYLKSSAATNPGSSGGPLLNRNGEVIGIVLSHKDDFCYSLPMKEILPGKAALHRRLTCGFTVFAKQKRITLDLTWDLPLPYRELADRYFAAIHDFYRDGMEKLLAENKQDLFPEGPNSEQALFDSVDGSFPQFYLQDNRNGSWFGTHPEIETANIGNNGYVSSAEVYKDQNIWLLRLKTPNDISVRELWDTPRKAMDLLLKGINITRRLTEKDQGSRILSYGPPVQTLSFSDRFGRNWQINVFFLEYSDQFVMTCATPTPQGLSLIYLARPSEQKDMWLYDMRKFADFVNVSYYGTLEQWDSFLKREVFAFGPMKALSVSYTEGAFADIDTACVTMHIREGLIHITKDSDLYLGCSVYLKDGKPRWDVRKMLIDTGSGNDADYFTIYRWSAPTSSLSEDVKNQWKSAVLEHRHPYSGAVYTESGRMNVGMLHPDFLLNGKVTIKKDYAYTLFASKEGSASEEEMKTYIQTFARETRIKD